MFKYTPLFSEGKEYSNQPVENYFDKLCNQLRNNVPMMVQEVEFVSKGVQKIKTTDLTDQTEYSR